MHRGSVGNLKMKPNDWFGCLHSTTKTKCLLMMRWIVDVGNAFLHSSKHRFPRIKALATRNKMFLSCRWMDSNSSFWASIYEVTGEWNKNQEVKGNVLFLAAKVWLICFINVILPFFEQQKNKDTSHRQKSVWIVSAVAMIRESFLLNSWLHHWLVDFLDKRKELKWTLIELNLNKQSAEWSAHCNFPPTFQMNFKI